MPNQPTPDLKQGRRQPQRLDPAKMDRLPPHSPEAEQGMLGSILQDPVQTMPVVIEKLKRGSEEIYDLRHQTILNTLLELYDDQIAIDVITLQQRLKDWGTLEQVGGIGYLQILPEASPSSANIESYVDIVHEKFVQRTIIRTCSDVVARLYENEGQSADELIEKVEHDLLLISQERSIGTAMPSTVELVRQVLDEIETSVAQQGIITGLSTGFPDLDVMTDGLHPGEMIIIAGRPSLGKTSLAMNIVDHVAVNLGLPVGVFSLEMTSKALMYRMVCCRARVNMRQIRRGYMAEQDYPKITAAAGTLSHARLYIDDRGGLSVLQLRAKARRMHQQYGIKLAVIDYGQLLNANGSKQKHDSRQQEMAFISQALKSLAKELGIPVIVLSQLNRESEQKNYGKPKLSNLRDSGALEQDADVVGLLYKPMSDDEDAPATEQYDTVPTTLDIAKQRSGPTGPVHLIFERGITRFESAARVVDSDDAPTSQHGLPYSDP